MRKLPGFMFAVVCSLSVMAQVPQSQHVYIVLEENHSFEGVDGHMPYLNGLAAQNTLLVNSFANSHFSIPNYMRLTTGQFLTLNDGTQATFDVDNIVRHLQAGGKTWTAYEEGIPNAGYTGFDLPTGCGSSTNPCVYVKHHDPFPYFTDVANSSEARTLFPSASWLRTSPTTRSPITLSSVPLFSMMPMTVLCRSRTPGCKTI